MLPGLTTADAPTPFLAAASCGRLVGSRHGASALRSWCQSTRERPAVRNQPRPSSERPELAAARSVTGTSLADLNNALKQYGLYDEDVRAEVAAWLALRKQTNHGQARE